MKVSMTASLKMCKVVLKTKKAELTILEYMTQNELTFSDSFICGLMTIANDTVIQIAMLEEMIESLKEDVRMFNDGTLNNKIGPIYPPEWEIKTKSNFLKKKKKDGDKPKND